MSSIGLDLDSNVSTMHLLDNINQTFSDAGLGGCSRVDGIFERVNQTSSCTEWDLYSNIDSYKNAKEEFITKSNINNTYIDESENQGSKIENIALDIAKKPNDFPNTNEKTDYIDIKYQRHFQIRGKCVRETFESDLTCNEDTDSLEHLDETKDSDFNISESFDDEEKDPDWKPQYDDNSSGSDKDEVGDKGNPGTGFTSNTESNVTRETVDVENVMNTDGNVKQTDTETVTTGSSKKRKTSDYWVNEQNKRKRMLGEKIFRSEKK